MTNFWLIKYRFSLSLAGLVALLAIMALPLMASASTANRVFYNTDRNSFNPAGAFGGLIEEGYGKGINKLTINAGPQAYTVTFVIHNNNQSGQTGTTFFETRKGPGNNDLSSFVSLSASPDFTGASNTATLNFNGTADSPLYVQVTIPPCGSDGTFRIQAHPSGTTNQGNGPGVMVFVKCNGFIPPASGTAT